MVSVLGNYAGFSRNQTDLASVSTAVLIITKRYENCFNNGGLKQQKILDCWQGTGMVKKKKKRAVEN